MAQTEADRKREYQRLRGRAMDVYLRAYGIEWYKGKRRENERAAHEAGMAAVQRMSKEASD